MPATAAKIVSLSADTASSFGSTGAMTRRLMGVTNATLKIVDKTEEPKILNFLGPGSMAAEVSQMAEGTIEMVANYEEMPKIFNQFFTAIVTSTVTSGAPYTYPYTAPVSSTQAVHLHTIEIGTSGAAYRANSWVGNDLTIKGEAGGLWNLTVNGIAKEVIPATSGISTGPAIRTVNPIRMADTLLYIDAFSTATVGATQVTATLISFEAAVKTGRHMKILAGSLAPQSWGEGRMEGTLKMTAEFNASAKALVDELLSTSTGAAVKRQIRISASEGSSESVRSCRFDFAGIKTEGETLFGDRDGNLTVDFTWNGVYSTGLSNWFAANVQNGSSSTT